MTDRVTHADVAALLADPSIEARAQMAGRIAALFASERLNDREQQLAADVFRAVMNHAAVAVREALSQHLRMTPILPRDIALTLARDVDSVALPVLEASPALADEDLLEIIRSASEARQVAIANRSSVSESVADALVDTGNERVVSTLVGNDGAQIAEQTLQKVMDTFPSGSSVHEHLVKRRTLPIAVVERLVTRLSDTMRQYLVVHHALPADLAAELLDQAREKATISLANDGEGVEELVRQLHANSRLTPSIVVRAVCCGDIAFFETALAALADVPVDNARALIYDSGALGLRAICKKAELPDGLYPIINTALSVAHETGYDGEPGDRERYQRRMLERILTDLGDSESENIEYLLTRLGRLYGNKAPAMH